MVKCVYAQQISDTTWHLSGSVRARRQHVRDDHQEVALLPASVPPRRYAPYTVACSPVSQFVVSLGLAASSFIAVSIVTIPAYILIALPAAPDVVVLISSFLTYVFVGLALCAGHGPNRMMLGILGGRAMKPADARKVRKVLPAVTSRCLRGARPTKIRVYGGQQVSADPLGGKVLRLSRRGIRTLEEPELTALVAREAAPLAEATPLCSGMGIWFAAPAMWLYYPVIRLTYRAAAVLGVRNPLVLLLRAGVLVLFGGAVAFRRCSALCADHFAAHHGFAAALVRALQTEDGVHHVEPDWRWWLLDLSRPEVPYRVRRLTGRVRENGRVTLCNDPTLWVSLLPLGFLALVFVVLW